MESARQEPTGANASGWHRWLQVSPGEWRPLVISFLYFFFVLAAYYVIRPVRDQLSAAVGSTQLPWFYAATFLATLVLTPLFAWLASRYPRRVMVPAVYLFFIACLLAFVPLFTQSGLFSPRALGTMFFVWVSVFNLFVVSVFWSFMVDLWDTSQARRLFPVIALGGTVGAITGPMLTRTLASVIGIAPLLVVSACLLGAALTCVVLLGRWASARHADDKTESNEGALGGSMLDGLKQVLSHPFIRNMALLLLLGDAIGTVNYALVADYAGATFVGDNAAVLRTEFFAKVDFTTNVLQILAQLTLTRWLLVRFGAGPVIGVWAGAGLLMMLCVVFTQGSYAPVIGGLPWVVLGLIVTRSLAYGMLGPARESLFTLVPRDLRYKGKNAVDTAVWRLGDLTISLGMNGLRMFGIAVSGFAAIVGGLHSYPLALLGALLVGQLESFSSFWASAFKEVIVFTLIIPVLWWRSLHTHHVEDEE